MVVSEFKFCNSNPVFCGTAPESEPSSLLVDPAPQINLSRTRAYYMALNKNNQDHIQVSDKIAILGIRDHSIGNC